MGTVSILGFYYIGTRNSALAQSYKRVDVQIKKGLA